MKLFSLPGTTEAERKKRLLEELKIYPHPEQLHTVYSYSSVDRELACVLLYFSFDQIRWRFHSLCTTRNDCMYIVHTKF